MAIQCTLEKSRTDGKYFARARKTGKVGMKEKNKGNILPHAAT